MNMTATRLLALAAAILAFVPSSRADDADAVRRQVWNTYLGDAERTSLSGMMDQMARDSRESRRQSAAVPPEKAIELARKQFRDYTAKWAPPLAEIDTEPFDSKGVKGVLFKTDGADKERVWLYLHGGGYVVGSPETAASITGYLARESGIPCFSVDYPLAPESPFPAALDNAVLAYRMLLDRGYKPGHIVLAGDSAGGGLVLATLAALRDRKLPMPAGAYLISPWTDLSLGFPSHREKKEIDSVLSRDFLTMMLKPYAGTQDVRNPLISPAFADLTGLCPLLVHVGSHEILLDDALTIARNAAMADVPVRLEVWSGYSHDFPMYHGRLEAGRKALQDAARFAGEVTGKTSARH